jgi:integrase
VAHSRNEQQAPSLRPILGASKNRKLVGALPRGVAVTNAVNGAGKRYFRVRLGKKFTGGKPIVRSFANLDAAREWIFGPRNGQPSSNGCGSIVALKRVAGASAFAITPTQLNEAAWAFNALAGHSLITAVEFYLKHASQPRRSKHLSEFIDEHIAAIAEAGGGERYQGNQRIACNVLVRELGDPLLASVTTDDVRHVIARMKWKPLNQRNYIRDWGMCFRRAVRFNYLESNPIDQLVRPRVARSEPAIYTVAEARQLLELARTEFTELLPFISIGLFAGVRVEEMRRMDWSMIDLQHGFISLKSSVTKSGEPRDIEIMPNLQQWLKLCGKAVGPIMPQTGFRQWVDALFRGAGFRRRNGLRHSFASYFLAITCSPEKTQMALGQQTPSVLFRHYRQVVRPGEASAYWTISP